MLNKVWAYNPEAFTEADIDEYMQAGFEYYGVFPNIMIGGIKYHLE